MGQPPRRPVTHVEVRGEIPPSAWASAHVLPAALLRTSPLALVSGGPAVWRGSCSGEGLHRLDGQRRCSILVMAGLGRRACHEATFRAIPRWIPRSATRVGNLCMVSVVLARCARRHTPSVAVRQGVRVLAKRGQERHPCIADGGGGAVWWASTCSREPWPGALGTETIMRSAP